MTAATDSNNEERPIKISKQNNNELQQQQPSSTNNNESKESTSSPSLGWPTLLPSWAKKSNRIKWGEKVNISEWDTDDDDDHDDNNHDENEMENKIKQNNVEYRLSNGWKGCDLIHSKSSPVRVLEYRLSYYFQIPNPNSENSENNPTTSPSSSSSAVGYATLTGIVHFTKNAESHQSYCHGGSMCSIMDDIIGWTGFCVSGQIKPWSGYTVQINTKLCKPIHVDSILKIICRVVNIDEKKRKVWLKAILFDPGLLMEEDDVDLDIDCSTSSMEELCSKLKPCIHAEGEGLVILNKG